MMGIIFLLPLIQLFILSFAVTTEVKHIPLLIADFDNSLESYELIRKFSHTEQFDLVDYSYDLREIRDKMESWKVQAALVIPSEFGRDLKRRLNPEIQLIVDGVDGNSAAVAIGYARSILVPLGLDFASSGQSNALSKSLVTMKERMWYNPDLSTRQYMVPGIVVMLLTILPMMLSAMSLVREKEIGTLEQLIVTPLKKHQLLLGKLIPFLILSYIELSLVMTTAVIYFKIQMKGSYILLALLSLVYLVATLGCGIFISTITNSQQQSMFIAWFFMVFMVLMSGFFIPIPNMPYILQKLTYLNPMRYFMFIIRDIFQKGSSLQFLWRDAVSMAGFSLIIFIFSILKFQKRVG